MFSGAEKNTALGNHPRQARDPPLLGPALLSSKPFLNSLCSLFTISVRSKRAELVFKVSAELILGPADLPPGSPMMITSTDDIRFSLLCNRSVKGRHDKEGSTEWILGNLAHVDMFIMYIRNSIRNEDYDKDII